MTEIQRILYWLLVTGGFVDEPPPVSPAGGNLFARCRTRIAGKLAGENFDKGLLRWVGKYLFVVSDFQLKMVWRWGKGVENTEVGTLSLCF